MSMFIKSPNDHRGCTGGILERQEDMKLLDNIHIQLMCDIKRFDREGIIPNLILSKLIIDLTEGLYGEEYTQLNSMFRSLLIDELQDLIHETLHPRFIYPKFTLE